MVIVAPPPVVLLPTLKSAWVFLHPSVTVPTGLCYSEKFTEHLTGPLHPERPERVSYTFEVLKGSDLANQLLFLEPLPAPLSWIEEIHSRDYIARVERVSKSGASLLDSADTGISKESYRVALYAVGAGFVLVDRVLAGEIRNGFALVRPPGHHAERKLALGFCLFNNIAICARYLQKRYGLERILIVDWDVHHGNGTQHAFEEDPTVFYFSIHQYPFYPGTGSSGERGIGKGVGTTLNIPMPAGSGDSEYLDAFEKIFIPQAESFRPDFVLISAGFDAHQSDPLAGMNLTEEGYAKMTQCVRRLAEASCQGRVVSFLEGGYDLKALSRSVYVHLKQLIAERPPE